MIHIFVLKLKNKTMKLLIKETLIFTLEMLKFFFISVPIGCLIFFTAHLFFELKRVYNGK